MGKLLLFIVMGPDHSFINSTWRCTFCIKCRQS